MQKKLIALAIAGLSSSAFAQSNVTLYGVADIAFESVQATGATTSTATSDFGSRTRITSNGSLVGLKGSEDLGDGLKAIYQYETFVEFGTNNTAAGANTNTLSTQTTGNQSGLLGNRRDSYIGLSGDFGTVLGGYLSLPYRSTARSFDVMPGSTGVGEMGGVFGKATPTISFLSRINAIAYASPKFGGFSGVLAYVPNANKSYNNVANEVNPSGWNLALNYATGGLKVAYSYLKLSDLGVGGTGASAALNSAGVAVITPAAPMLDESHKVHLLGAGYDFGQGTTVNAVFQSFKGELNTGVPATSGDLTRKSWWVGAKHVAGPNEFALSFAKANELKGSRGAADTGARQVAFRYGYSLSKRTQVYGIATKITNDNAAAFNFGTAGVSAFGNGADPRSIGAGVRHTF